MSIVEGLAEINGTGKRFYHADNKVSERAQSCLQFAQHSFTKELICILEKHFLTFFRLTSLFGLACLSLHFFYFSLSTPYQQIQPNTIVFTNSISSSFIFSEDLSLLLRQSSFSRTKIERPRCWISGVVMGVGSRSVSQFPFH